ncbi:hypothetical protein C1752_13128 [Acaryochloris thomasi RCC1774]|uniref:Uncharacterized protein n=1 Tax=Acaryochloris thomasi RCC1774 TaxID=1764569 RepID=A0A2W1JGU8_9CYAN|nr:hypothetical protein C1752_13128 [Acaryochloris thomasi RCC1774]
MRLQETEVPATDKIFPWVVVAVINRVIEELLRGDLQELRREIEQVPQEIGRQLVSSVREALTEPVQEIRAARQDFRTLAQELRASAVLDASLSQSGWRGIGAAVGAIFRLENLMVVFAGTVFVSLIMGILLSNWLSARDRHIIKFNKGVIRDCKENYAADADKNGWYTCPIFQLPMPKK